MDSFFSLEGQVAFASVLNAIAMIAQLVKTAKSREVRGLSFVMLSFFAYMQIIFAVNAWEIGAAMTVWGMSISAVCTILIIVIKILVRCKIIRGVS